MLRFRKVCDFEIWSRHYELISKGQRPLLSSAIEAGSSDPLIAAATIWATVLRAKSTPPFVVGVGAHTLNGPGAVLLPDGRAAAISKKVSGSAGL